MDAERLKDIALSIANDKDLLLGNLILLGEVPSYAGTWQSDDQTDRPDYSVRARFFAERLAELGVDECATDSLGNPVALVKGSDPSKPPLLVVAELDSLFNPPGDIHYEIKGGNISGPGLLDNALGAVAVLSLPQTLKRLGISLDSNLMLAGVPNTMRDAKNIALFDRFAERLTPLPRAAIVVKGGELGRLNYFSDAVIRADIICERREGQRGSAEDMVLVATSIVDQLLGIRIPKKPETELTVGMIKAGHKYGDHASQARIGIELRSVSNEVLAELSGNIRDVLDLVRFEKRVDVIYDVAVELGAANLGWDHPLTRTAVGIMRSLGIEPDVYPSVSELYYLLKRGIPAVTIGIGKGSDYHQESAYAGIESICRGMTQLAGLMLALDEEARRG